jgi:CheY-like chemotaxis protein
MPLRVLLVEDEVMIRMMVADMVEELGHAVAAEAGDVGRAAALAQTGLFDLAILDVNLNGKMSFPVADIIVQRRIPLIFAPHPSCESLSRYRRLQRRSPLLARVPAIRMIKPKRTAARKKPRRSGAFSLLPIRRLGSLALSRGGPPGLLFDIPLV